MEIGNPSQN